MPKRKTAAPEATLPGPEVEPSPAKPARQMVEATHTIKYSQPVPVSTAFSDEVVEEPEDAEEFFEDVDDEIEEGAEEAYRPRRKPNSRDRLKKKLDAMGIGGTSDLKLRVDRLPYYDIDGRTGMNAEKEFVRIFSCQETYILNEEYLDEVSKLYGPGAYQFTLRHGTAILRSWHKKISGPPIASSPLAQNGDAPAHPPAPGYPQLQFTPPPPRSFKEELKELIATQRLMRELGGDTPAQPTQQPQPDPEIALLTMLARDDSVMDKLSKGVLSKFLGDKAGSNEWADVAMEAIKSGQAATIIQSAIGAIFAGFGNLIPQGTRNGQPIHPGQQSLEPQAPSQGAPDQTRAMSPEENLLNFVLQRCAINEAPEAVCDGIIEYAEFIRVQQPLHSGVINHRINLFANVPTEMAVEFVRQLPGGAQIAEMPHTAEWTTRLQQLLKLSLIEEPGAAE